jgi:EAL domain-containing protein (putative c-di-GMP-specific phosphodiesterase class I)
LNIKVVAEGVETVEQLSFLRGTACHRVQGYLFSEAVRPEKLEQLLQSRKKQGQVFH